MLPCHAWDAESDWRTHPTSPEESYVLRGADWWFRIWEQLSGIETDNSLEKSLREDLSSWSLATFAAGPTLMHTNNLRSKMCSRKSILWEEISAWALPAASHHPGKDRKYRVGKRKGNKRQQGLGAWAVCEMTMMSDRGVGWGGQWSEQSPLRQHSAESWTLKSHGFSNAVKKFTPMK